MITISEDCDWCTAVCHRLFCLRLKIYAFRHGERETKSELKRHRSVQRKRDTPLKQSCCKTERKHSLIISAWHFSPGLGDAALSSHCFREQRPAHLWLLAACHRLSNHVSLGCLKRAEISRDCVLNCIKAAGKYDHLLSS